MADPKRLVVLKALCSHLEAQVRTTNGFQHDLQGRVFRGRSVFGQDDPLPMVSVLSALLVWPSSSVLDCRRLWRLRMCRVSARNAAETVKPRRSQMSFWLTRSLVTGSP